MNIKKLVIIGSVVGILILGLLMYIKQKKQEVSLRRPVRIGYFHGGRTMLLYRSYINNEYEKGGVSVELLTHDLGETKFKVASKNFQDIVDVNFFGRVSGIELLNGISKGDFDGVVTGETSFLKAVHQDLPVVAVALLGHDIPEAPAHAVLLRKGLKVNSPSDLKGKVFAARRSGDGDIAYLKDFFVKMGLDPDKDVQIAQQVDEDEWMDGMRTGKFDGGYYHLVAVKKLVDEDVAYIYKTLDWIDPETSQALLVFGREYAKQHPQEIKALLRVYMKRIKYEQSLPEKNRLEDPANDKQIGLQMAMDYHGMNLPQYSTPPLVSESVLKTMQDLLYKYEAIGAKDDLAPYIDNSFVKALMKEKEM